MKLKWTDELTKRAKECCAGASSVPAAYRKWKRLTGADVTLAAFRQKMDNESPLGSASGMLKTAGSKGVTDAHALYIRIRKEPLSVDDAADSLEWCPRRVRAAYDSARAIGLAMQLVNGQLMFVRAVDEEAKRLDLGDAEATDGAINGISDLHIGSNYFMHDALAAGHGDSDARAP